jgi:hypothetical protein
VISLLECITREHSSDIGGVTRRIDCHIRVIEVVAACVECAASMLR